MAQLAATVDPSWAGHAVRCLLATDYGEKIAVNPVDAGKAALTAAGNDCLRGLISRFLIARTQARRNPEDYEDAVVELLEAIESSDASARRPANAFKPRLRYKFAAATRCACTWHSTAPPTLKQPPPPAGVRLPWLGRLNKLN